MPNTDFTQKRLSRKNRKLSIFMTQEMLFEYSQERLDADRKQAVEREIEKSEDLRFQLKILTAAEEYTKHLAKTKIAEAHILSLKKYRPWTETIIVKMKWRNWPDLMRWSAEALAVSIVVVLVAIFLPWEKARYFEKHSKTEVTLAEINLNAESEEDPLPPMEQREDTSREDTSREDTNVKNEEINTQTTIEAAEVPTAAPKPASTLMPTSTPADLPKAAPATAENKVLPMNALLINVMMNLKISEATADKIRDLVVKAGGVKAGQVELGWRKTNPDGHYYHFALPETNYQKLMSDLSKYSALRIYKNPHKRVMPEGTVRVILWVESKKSDEEGPLESPGMGE